MPLADNGLRIMILKIIDKALTYVSIIYKKKKSEHNYTQISDICLVKSVHDQNRPIRLM